MFGFIILVPPRWEGMAPVGDAGVTQTKGVALP